ncbi:TetR family transcriptional regulator [Streptomyces sp. NPDC002896]|uniref:acyl-CoA-like ligand-binding transcription factor n=1 Tax=Streptomyces sp. NPDC002896 TaxID=3154438 RepID=UPI003329F69B
MVTGKRSRGRPAVSSRQDIETRAIALFLEHGYEGTTLGAITDACGVSKTTFFRYYTSKAAIIWSAFEEHTAILRRLLREADPRVPVMTAVRTAVVEAFRASMDDEGTWMKRFVILDTSPALRAEESAQWISWAGAVAEHVARRTEDDPGALAPASIGGAVQAAFLATLRGWRTAADPAPAFARRLDADLKPLCDILQEWLDRR